MKTKHHLLLLALVIALAAIPTVGVLAKELGLLTITGPGIKNELTLDDQKYMMKLEESGFFDQTSLAKAPENLNLKNGYHISAELNLDGKMVPFVEMTYYAINEGQPGYAHYTGRMHGDAMTKVDQWSVLSLEADQAFRGLMLDNNVTLQSALVAASVKSESAAEAPAASAAEPLVVPVTSTSPAPLPSAYTVLAVAATLIFLLGAGLAIRRRTISTSS